MATLTVRKLDKEIIQKLKARAGKHGISAEEEHRRILKQALNTEDDVLPLKDFIKTMPNWGEEEIFQRGQQNERKLQL